MGDHLYQAKLMYGIISAFITPIAYTIAYFLNFKEFHDLAEMYVGSTMVSVGVVHLLINANLYTSDKYPYSMLITLVVFLALTLYQFIYDSIALLDESLLVKCDIISTAPISIQDDLPIEDEGKPKFSLGQNLVGVLLYIAAIFEAITAGMNIATYQAEVALNKTFPFILPIRFLEALCVAIYLRDMPLHPGWYVVMTILLSACTPLFACIPSLAPSQCLSDILFGAASAILLGFFGYIGGSALHNSRLTAAHKPILSAACALIGFGIPMLFQLLVGSPVSK